jgi:predicted secreted protein
LHLSQTAERTIRRDRLRLQLRVEATAPDARQVQAEVNKRMSAALEKARNVAGVKVESGGYTVYEERQANVPTRWHGGQGLVLTSGDFPVLLTLGGALQTDGLAMSGMSFELAPETARGAQDDLTAEALKQLRDRIERVAADLQMELVRLRDLRVGNAEGEERPVFRAAVLAGAAAPTPMPPPSGEPGETTVRVTVEADALLGPTDQSRP